MKTVEYLYKEVARVIKMCEGTDINWVHCISVDGMTLSQHPMYDCEPERYTFAQSIKDGKPIFKLPNSKRVGTFEKIINFIITYTIL